MKYFEELELSDETLLGRLVVVKAKDTRDDGLFNPYNGVYTIDELFRKLGFYGFVSAFIDGTRYPRSGYDYWDESVVILDLIDLESGKRFDPVGVLRVINRYYALNAYCFRSNGYVRNGAKARKTRNYRRPGYIAAMRLCRTDHLELDEPEIRPGYIARLKMSYGRPRTSGYDRSWKQFRKHQYKDGVSSPIE